MFSQILQYFRELCYLHINISCTRVWVLMHMKNSYNSLLFRIRGNKVKFVFIYNPQLCFLFFFFYKPATKHRRYVRFVMAFAQCIGEFLRCALQNFMTVDEKYAYNAYKGETIKHVCIYLYSSLMLFRMWTKQFNRLRNLQLTNDFIVHTYMKSLWNTDILDQFQRTLLPVHRTELGNWNQPNI